MPRKQRIEYPGAVYHVISRGNYRKELFVADGSGEAFEKAVFEAVERCGWELHAYVIMGNHYHLAVETPEPNLVVGMSWLQSTFATRFNRFRNERGHVFQGRYKAILVGEGRSLPGLVDYIHLNPVRAGICELDRLREYKLSSYPRFFARSVRAGLCRERFLAFLGLPASPEGMRRYAEHLQLSEAGDAGKRAELERRYCRGWFIGTREEKKEISEELAANYPGVDWEGADLQELNQASWEKLVADHLRRLRKDDAALAREPKGAPWKIEIARALRRQTTANNRWIAERLHMGHPSRVSNLISTKGQDI